MRRCGRLTWSLASRAAGSLLLAAACACGRQPVPAGSTDEAGKWQTTRPTDTGPAPSSTAKPPGAVRFAQPGGERRAPRLPRRRASDAPPQLAPQQLAAHGIHKVVGQHLTLYTDLPVEPAIEALAAVFDQAVPQWCDYFGVARRRMTDWHMTGYLIEDPAKFHRLGVLGDHVPSFLHGYQRGSELWLYEQPSDYYRRHLLLHEGTHGFMHRIFGGAGPPWYMEGVAELLATHRWSERRLTLNTFPRDKLETPHWGRIKAIRQELLAGRRMTLKQILHYDERAHLRLEPYAWCWAASTFFQHHPTTSRAFGELGPKASDRSAGFTQQFIQPLAEDWPFLSHQWQMFLMNLDYGYEVQRELFDRQTSRPLGAGSAVSTVAASRGWQSTGLRLEQGKTYHFAAEGRFVIGSQPNTWWCEANGVTIQYYRGLPLGMLLAAVFDPNVEPGQNSPLADPIPIGLGRTWTLERSGTLHFRVNDHPAQLADNRGEVIVTTRSTEAIGDSGVPD